MPVLVISSGCPWAWPGCDEAGLPQLYLWVWLGQVFEHQFLLSQQLYLYSQMGFGSNSIFEIIYLRIAFDCVTVVFLYLILWTMEYILKAKKCVLLDWHSQFKTKRVKFYFFFSFLFLLFLSILYSVLKHFKQIRCFYFADFPFLVLTTTQKHKKF